MDNQNMKFEMVPVDDLLVDTKNPRVAQWIEMYKDGVTEDGMRLAVQGVSAEGDSTGPSYTALKQSIRTSGRIIHPILVNREADMTMKVIEGNTRTLIYKEFKENGVTGNWDTIPAIIYENMPEHQIDAIRLQSHLVGPRDWDPYSKAKYLNTLSNQGMPFSLIVEYCGGNKREVESLIAAYNDMETHYRPIVESKEKSFEHTRFSAFKELQKPRITQALFAAHYTKADFAQWVDELKFHPLAKVRDLPRILQNEKSKEVFLKDGAEEAIRVLDALVLTTSVDLENASLIQIAKVLHKRITSISWGEIQNLRSDPDTEQKDVLRDIKDALVDFIKDINTED